MSGSEPQDLSGFSMLELFRQETEMQAALLTETLLAVERQPDEPQHLDVLMRASHSLKGAGRMVGLAEVVRLTHNMEDFFVKAQKEKSRLSAKQVDILLDGVDLLNRIAKLQNLGEPGWESSIRPDIDVFLKKLSSPVEPDEDKADTEPLVPEPLTDAVVESEAIEEVTAPETVPESMESGARVMETQRQAVRVASETLNNLLNLAGESLVASRWLDGYTSDLLHLKRLQQMWGGAFLRLQQLLAECEVDERVRNQVNEVLARENACRDALGQRLVELDMFEHRLMNLSKRLHEEVLDCRMRPFSDGIQGFPRMVRDIARELGKEVSLEIKGETTPVDRDILERIESPLSQLLRNAVDHGIELPEERRRAGKRESAVIRLEAHHSAGFLLITVEDNGAGVDLEKVRGAVITNGLASTEVAERLSEGELLEFLFLPGFTMRSTVTEISGRGVGLDVVQTIVKEVGGSVRITTERGQGTRFQLQLPLTLSVIRTLLADISGEPYAFPLNRITSATKVAQASVESLEGRQHFEFNGRRVGLVMAHQVLDLKEGPPLEEEVPIIVLGDNDSQYGVVVDRFLGERELTVRSLDPRLGKVQDVSAAALLPDQTPVLIIDTEDLLRSIEVLTSGERPARIWHESTAAAQRARKRVLVVDDSLTVRELQRKLIGARGYEVEVAVDGADAWNAIRSSHYDLIVTDVDMPRMDGIELVTLIKRDPRLHALPVMIVSYKDREADRQRGLEAGADYYLTKGSFHDEALIEAVVDLIGEAQE